MSYPLSEPGPDVAATTARWLVEYVGSTHPDLGRDGPVCPFVLPALKNGSLTVLEHRWEGPHEVSRMVGLIAEVAERFRTRQRSRRDELNALVVVVTGLPRSAWWLVDEAHRRAKHLVVAQGYMVGQFHPECREPAVHNRRFAVNTAPYPVFAIRRMAVHDILFLHRDPTWFEKYRTLFGHRFAGETRINEHLRELYERTCRRYASARLEVAAHELADTVPAAGTRAEGHKEPSWKSN